MIVTGPNLAPEGATVVDISGTTITMGQASYPQGTTVKVGSGTLEPYFRRIAVSTFFGQKSSDIHWGNRIISGFVPSPGDILVSTYSSLAQRIPVVAVATYGFTTGQIITTIQRNYLTEAVPDKLNISWNNKGQFTATYYREIVFTAQTYTFTAPNDEYTFRTDVGLPYGSFPGVGLTQ